MWKQIVTMAKTHQKSAKTFLEKYCNNCFYNNCDKKEWAKRVTISGNLHKRGKLSEIEELEKFTCLGKLEINYENKF